MDREFLFVCLRLSLFRHPDLPGFFHSSFRAINLCLIQKYYQI